MEQREKLESLGRLSETRLGGGGATPRSHGSDHRRLTNRHLHPLSCTLHFLTLLVLLVPDDSSIKNGHAIHRKSGNNPLVTTKMSRMAKLK